MATSSRDLRDLLPLLEIARADAPVEDAVAQELVAYATTDWGDYWASRALDWVDQGVWSTAINRSLSLLSQNKQYSQQTRHRAWHYVKPTEGGSLDSARGAAESGPL